MFLASGLCWWFESRVRATEIPGGHREDVCTKHGESTALQQGERVPDPADSTGEGRRGTTTERQAGTQWEQNVSKNNKMRVSKEQNMSKYSEKWE